VFADEGDEDAGQSSPVASPEDTSGDQESPEPSTHVDHKQRLAEILLDKLEKGDPVDEALVDRITGLIG
jgi:hypothetical protein